MKRLMIGVTAIALVTGSVAVARPEDNRNNRGDSEQHGQRGDGEQRGPQWQDGRWHDQNGNHDNGRHRGWSQDRGDSYNWNRGQRMGYNDWRYAQRVDYRRYNLRQPPRGYEWRRSNDRFVLAAVATGVIMSVILSNGR